MSGHPDELGRLLRWYPPAWRDRYGDELVALLEDELDGTAPTVRLRVSLAVIRGPPTGTCVGAGRRRR